MNGLLKPVKVGIMRENIWMFEETFTACLRGLTKNVKQKTREKSFIKTLESFSSPEFCLFMAYNAAFSRLGL